jgi:hypothetical protein
VIASVPQRYFQRYVARLPAAGEIVPIDRSWYNRAGVERIMGFCSEQGGAECVRDAIGTLADLVTACVVLGLAPGFARSSSIDDHYGTGRGVNDFSRSACVKPHPLRDAQRMGSQP